MPKVKKVCLHCGKIFYHYTSTSLGKFCSTSCSAKVNVRRIKPWEACRGKESWNKGKKWPKETREKISKALKKRFEKEDVWNKGIKANEHPGLAKALEKAHEAARGKPAWNRGLTKETDKRVAKYARNLKGMKKPWQEGIKHHQWKGKGVSYVSLHKWIARRLGKPDTCEHCGKSGLSNHQIHWANKSGKYKRVLSDWVRLCVKCHYIFDNSKG